MQKSTTMRGPLSAKDIELARMPCYVRCEYLNTDISFPTVCDLCFEDMEAASMFRVLPCGHIFHKPCVDCWILSRDASCPLCRKTFYDLRVSKFSRTHMTDCGGRDRNHVNSSWHIPRWVMRGIHFG
ncbi:uncharacterized protein N7458_006288 [Penicillium daleae]|uniref:RING-type domain-containing protein n=1 Tax=Penicillium daleae TaxID=63821 RepID=A0AAD6C4G1_9EURO|nr:uncharacterized protein N7458_006288 [Penicillium daleae]KAJ5449839.1 hypothetical protein N7458_006288 [Penicillium daleae]